MQPTREEMITAIYEKIADKTLSFGCKIKNNIWWSWVSIWDGRYILDDRVWTFNWDFAHDVIGHPVMIWDVLDWMYSEKWPCTRWDDMMLVHLMNKRKQKRLPLEEQDDDCIRFIFELIQDAKS